MTNAANEMGVFERVVERGSFAAAAQDGLRDPLDVSPRARWPLDRLAEPAGAPAAT